MTTPARRSLPSRALARAAHGFLACVLCGSLLLATRPAAAGGFVVLVNGSNQVASLTRSELKRLTNGGTKQWDTGAVVQIGVIPSDAPETAYLASLVDLSPKELLTRIQEAVFKGELRRPAVLRSSSDCIAFSRQVPGAICAASDAEPLPPDVRAVPIR